MKVVGGAWTCDRCGRQFGRSKQAHECAPAMTEDEYFSTGPPFERPIFDAVIAHLVSVGPVHAEFVSVGVFLKQPRKFAELRPLAKWVALSFGLPRRVQHRTITRKVIPYSGRYHHVANLASVADLDEQLLDWIAESYLTS